MPTTQEMYEGKCNLFVILSQFKPPKPDQKWNICGFANTREEAHELIKKYGSPHHAYTVSGEIIGLWSSGWIVGMADMGERREFVSETKIEVPEGMLKAVSAAYEEFRYNEAFVLTERIRLGLCKAALRWQKENPPVPSDKDASEIWEMAHNLDRRSETGHAGKDFAIAWVRRMYDEPEPEVPEEPSDKERADCNMACLMHMIEMVEKGDVDGVSSYVKYVRGVLKLIELERRSGQKAGPK